MATRAPYLALVLAGCATAGRSPGAHGDVDAPPEPTIDAPEHATIDAPEGHPDAAPAAPDAPPPAPDAMTTAVASSLLLSEVQLAPTGGEFVEIVNPTTTAVALDHYYLSDSGTYWKLPAGSEALDAGDFIATFPAGKTIPGHGVVTIAMDTAANFTTADGVAPTYSIADGTMTV